MASGQPASRESVISQVPAWIRLGFLASILLLAGSLVWKATGTWAVDSGTDTLIGVNL